jgi:ABC-type uncharacterized transport system permease subunit
LTVATVLFAATAVIYALACVGYLGFLLGLGERAVKLGRVVLWGAFVAHMCEIGARGVAGLHPVTTAREAVGFISWLLVGGYLIAGLRRKLHAVGAFVAPAGLALLVAARLAPAAGDAAPSEGLGILGRVHISLAATGVSIFALATAVAIVYLVQERQLKQKRIGMLTRKGTALETLDTLSHRCVQLGFPIFTIAMITGAVWSARRSDGIRPEYTIAMFAWTAFAAALITRTTIGWRGRRAALMTILGFASALLVLGIYLARRALGA